MAIGSCLGSWAPHLGHGDFAHGRFLGRFLGRLGRPRSRRRGQRGALGQRRALRGGGLGAGKSALPSEIRAIFRGKRWEKHGKK